MFAAGQLEGKGKQRRRQRKRNTELRPTAGLAEDGIADAAPQLRAQVRRNGRSDTSVGRAVRDGLRHGPKFCAHFVNWLCKSTDEQFGESIAALGRVCSAAE